MLPWLMTPWLGPSPALLARLFGNGTKAGRGGASPEGACRVEYRSAAIGHPKVLRAGWEAMSGDQAEFPSPGNGFGPVGGAELAQDVGHVLFDCVERHHQVVGDALI
jgi:hypothetical protein